MLYDNIEIYIYIYIFPNYRNLGNNIISGTIPESFSQLKNLKAL